MAQVVTCRILTTETWVRDRASPCGICSGQSDTEAGFSPSSLFSPDNIIPPWLSLPILLSPGDENRLVGGSGSETVSPHRHEQRKYPKNDKICAYHLRHYLKKQKKKIK
jgi:hypothetical protein